MKNTRKNSSFKSRFLKTLMASAIALLLAFIVFVTVNG